MKQYYFSAGLLVAALMLVGAGCSQTDSETGTSPAINKNYAMEAVEELAEEVVEDEESAIDLESATEDVGEGMKRYVSTYGFSIEYSAEYDESDEYGVWYGNKSEFTGLLDDWGVNHGQETVLVVNVYPADMKGDFTSLTEPDTDLNGFEAYTVLIDDFWEGYLVEVGDNIIVVHSTTHFEGKNTDERYLEMLDTMQFE